MKVSKKLQSAIDLMKIICKEQNIALRVFYRECSYEAIGTTYYGKQKTRVNMYVAKYSVDYILSVFFHELGHVHCYRNRIYPGYHSHPSTHWSVFARATVRHGLQAERYVDNLGKQFAREYFPTKAFKWHPSYKTKEDIDWFKEIQLNPWLSQLQNYSKTWAK